jgi:hypothetical protein
MNCSVVSRATIHINKAKEISHITQKKPAKNGPPEQNCRTNCSKNNGLIFVDLAKKIPKIFPNGSARVLNVELFSISGLAWTKKSQ